MNEIENLSILLTASANDAIGIINRIAASLRTLEGAERHTAGAAEETAGAVNDMGMATAQAGTVVERTNATTRTFAQRLGTVIAPLRAFTREIGTGLVRAGGAGLRAVGNLISGIARIARFRIYRSLIKDLGQSFKDLYGYSKSFGGSFAQSMDRLAASTLYLRNSLAAMASPIIEMLTPAFETLVDVIVDVLNWVNQLFAALNGKETYTAARRVAQSWEDSFDSTAQSARRTAKEIKKTILGFDEINRLNGDTGRSTSGGTGSSPYSRGYTTMFEQRPIAGGFLGFSDAIERAMQDTLSRIGLIVSGASLAVGAILTFSGVNIPLGLAMMAAGAAGLASIIAINWNGLSTDIKFVIGAIETAVGGAMLAIGAIFTFTGARVGLGIGLMAAGAATLAAAVMLNWGFAQGKLEKTLRVVTTVVSAAALAIGAVLLFTGVHTGLGIALLAAGITGTVASINWDYISGEVAASAKAVATAVSLASLAIGAILAFSGVNVALGVGLIVAGVSGTAVTLSWDYLKEKITGKASAIAAGVSAATLALGAVLAFSGAATALGVGLMAAGAVGLITTTALNWDTIKDCISGVINDTSLLLTAGKGFLLLGAAFAFSGIALPLGIGMMLVGAAGIARAVQLNWETIKNKVSDVLNNTELLFKAGAGFFVLGALFALTGVAMPLGISMMLVGAAGIARAVTLNWKTITEKVNGVLNDTKTLLTVGAGFFVLGAIFAFTGVALPLGISMMLVGAAGIARAAKLNWNTIKDKVNSVLDDTSTLLKVGVGFFVLGAIFAFTGIALPLGITMMLVGAAGLARAATLNWETIKDKVNGVLTDTKTLFIAGAGFFVLGVILALTGIAMPLGISMMLVGAAGLARAAVLNWDAIKTKVSDVISKITPIIEGALLLLGIIAMVSGNIPLGIGLMIPAIVKLAETAVENWGGLVELGKTAIAKIKEGWDTAKQFVVDVVVKIAGKIWDGVTDFWHWLWTPVQRSGTEGLGETYTTFNPSVDMTVNAVQGVGWLTNPAADPTMWAPPIVDSIDVAVNGIPGDNFGEGGGGNYTQATKGFVSNVAAKARNFTLAPIQAAINQSPLQARVNLIDNSGTLWDTFKQWWDIEGDETHFWHRLYVHATIQDNVGSLWDSLVGWWNSGTRILYCSVVSSTSGWSIWDGIVRGWNSLSEHNLYCNVVARRSGGTLANGGVIETYANGTNRVNHGTVYVAGEAGPEVVGKIGNRTEVMNKFQLAEAMYTAVRGAMSGVSLEANFSNAGMDDEGMQVLLEMIQQSSEATVQQNELLRQQNELLRQINDKEFSADITTASISSAFNRNNKRAGVTVIPVGT